MFLQYFERFFSFYTAEMSVTHRIHHVKTDDRKMLLRFFAISPLDGHDIVAILYPRIQNSGPPFLSDIRRLGIFHTFKISQRNKKGNLVGFYRN